MSTDNDNSTIAQMREQIKTQQASITAAQTELATVQTELSTAKTTIEQLSPLQEQLATKETEFNEKLSELTTTRAKAELADKYEASLQSILDKELAKVPDELKPKIEKLIGNGSVEDRLEKLSEALELAGEGSKEIKLGGRGGGGGNQPGIGEPGAFDPKNVPSWNQALKRPTS